MSVATGDVAAVLSGLAILAFLESLSAVRQRQQQQQQQLQQPATFVQRKHHPRKKPRPPPAAALASSKKQSVCRPTAASKTHHQSFPRHVFALPTFSSLPSRPGRFDGAELVERLLTLQARQPRPNFECRRAITNSTYLRRLFICSEMSCLFPNPDDRRSWEGWEGSSPARAGGALALAQPPPPPLATFSAASSPAQQQLCAAALAPLSGNAAATCSRVHDPVAERSFRQRRADTDTDTDAYAAAGAAATTAAADAAAAAAAAAASAAASSSPMVSYEAVPVLDHDGRAFCVLVEWERSLTSRRAVKWKGRLTKGWEAVCAANRFQEGHEISLKLWLGGGGEGGGQGAAASGGNNGGQRKQQTAFVVVGREGRYGGLLGGCGGHGGGDESSLGGGAGNAPWENDENDAATGAFQPHQHQQQQF